MATKQDREILNSILNPYLPLGECVFDEDVPSDLRDEEIITPKIQEAKDLEVEAIKTAEAGFLDKSIEILTKAIHIAPNRASAYNNRAQAHRLNGNIEALYKHAIIMEIIKHAHGCRNNDDPQGNGGMKALVPLFPSRSLLFLYPAALEDLNNAINLSQGRGKAGCQAYCQRALIYKLQGNDDKANEDFKISAQLGNEFARSQLIQMNPYAALCNQMLGKVIEKLQKGEIVE